MRHVKSLALSFLLVTGAAQAEHECPKIPAPFLDAASLNLQAISERTGDYNAVEKTPLWRHDVCLNSHFEKAPVLSVTGLQGSLVIFPDDTISPYIVAEVEVPDNSPDHVRHNEGAHEEHAVKEEEEALVFSAASGLDFHLTPGFQLFADVGVLANGQDIAPQVQFAARYEFE